MGNTILEMVVREEISEEVMFRQGSELSEILEIQKPWDGSKPDKLKGEQEGMCVSLWIGK